MRTRRSPRNQEILWRALGGVRAPDAEANAAIEANPALGVYAELDGLVILADCNETDLPYWVG